ncbi:chaperonin-like RbcX protein 2, chloroplastic isoform X2 [Primulina huaijiensis]|uniref:chaperonin-like RbcX protein 2, chloroplastic isoform X2 n=1 Tax=Primulina huaijiensis TaxID=1492673 RepID=UPI003CC6E748
MVGAVSFVGSSVVDSHTTPRLFLDAMSSCNLSGGDLVFQRNLIALSGAKNLKKRRINKSILIVNELAGQYEDTFEDVKAQILTYFTYKAVRTVLNQLYEMNPTQYRWFYDFVASNENGYGKSFIRNLGKEKHDLAERVMVTRLHLYGKWIKKCDHAEMYERISDQNLQLMRERLVETVIWPTDDTSSEVVG